MELLHNKFFLHIKILEIYDIHLIISRFLSVYFY
jgi:hypothetical protein